MDKELEEAKKYLEYKVDKRKQGRNFFIDYEEEFKHEQTLLNYIENSISREVIERKLAKIEDKICGNDLYLGEKQSMKLELLGKVKQELLENKKRVGR